MGEKEVQDAISCPPPVSRERKLEEEDDETAKRPREPTTSTIYRLVKEGEGLTTGRKNGMKYCWGEREKKHGGETEGRGRGGDRDTRLQRREVNGEEEGNL